MLILSNPPLYCHIISKAGGLNGHRHDPQQKVTCSRQNILNNYCPVTKEQYLLT
jgi:hypothetical protein